MEPGPGGPASASRNSRHIGAKNANSLPCLRYSWVIFSSAIIRQAKINPVRQLNLFFEGTLGFTAINSTVQVVPVIEHEQRESRVLHHVKRRSCIRQARKAKHVKRIVKHARFRIADERRGVAAVQLGQANNESLCACSIEDLAQRWFHERRREYRVFKKHAAGGHSTTVRRVTHRQVGQPRAARRRLSVAWRCLSWPREARNVSNPPPLSVAGTHTGSSLTDNNRWHSHPGQGSSPRSFIANGATSDPRLQGPRLTTMLFQDQGLGGGDRKTSARLFLFRFVHAPFAVPYDSFQFHATHHVDQRYTAPNPRP